MAYTRTSDEAGYADGIVTITKPTDASGINNYVLYWGDDNGKLADYNAIATLDSGVTTYTMVSNTLIPEKATQLLAYSSDGSLLSENSASFAIAESWRLATEDMISSFEVVSDIHMNSNNTYEEHFTEALADIAATAPDSDAIFSVGDNVDTGTEGDRMACFYPCWRHTSPSCQKCSTLSGTMNISEATATPTITRTRPAQKKHNCIWMS